MLLNMTGEAVSSSNNRSTSFDLKSTLWDLAQSLEVVWNYWLSWLLTPIILAFILPLVICLFIYITSAFAYA